MSLSHLILGLLYRKPDSGYDLNKRFQRTVAHFWTTDQSQIYRTLYKLRDRGWVDVQTIKQDDNPDKKVYSVTDAGFDELVDWLHKPLADELVIRDAATGQVFFGDVLQPDQLLAVQQRHIERLQEKVETYHAVEQAVFIDVNLDAYPLGMELAHATLQYGIHAVEMQIDWREQLIRRIQKRLKRENTKGE